MSLYKRILVPVDGSATSMRGLREALRIAKSEGSRVWLLHVLDEFFALSDPESARYADVMIASFRRSGERVLAKAVAVARAKGARRAQFPHSGPAGALRLAPSSGRGQPAPSRWRTSASAWTQSSSSYPGLNPRSLAR
jgi:nucleotide-binding universal stress UspA family protein